MTLPEKTRRTARLVGLALVDALIIAIALWGSFELRLDPVSNPYYYHHRIDFFMSAYPILLAIRLFCNYFFGLYKWSFRFAGAHDIICCIKSLVAGSAAFFVSLYIFHSYLEVPFEDNTVKMMPGSIPFLEFFVSSTGIIMFRYLPKVFLFRNTMVHGKTRTLIVGAGGAGELLLRSFLQSPQGLFRIIGFVDDDPRKRGTSIHQIPVLGATEKIPALVDSYDIEMILLATPTADGHEIRRIIEICQQCQVKFKMVTRNLLNEGDNINILKEVEPEDLLDRQAVDLNVHELSGFFKGKNILVTGAAGSIGSEIVRQLCAFTPGSIFMLDTNENELYLQWLRNTNLYPDTQQEMLIANVREEPRMRRILKDRNIQVVFHAAAQKQVPLMEQFPEEAVKTNIQGTLNTGKAAIETGVETFVFISSDKAVNPTNVMGVTKRIAEFVLKDFISQKSATKFTSVRFGNVLGSQGSLLPILKAQIARGGPVTVTDPEITRYFMTIPEAVQLVLTASVRQEGTVQVLNMGKPIKIDRLVRDLITLSGFRPDIDIPIKYIGLRPGEKLHEELIAADEDLTPSSHEKILVAKGYDIPDNFQPQLEALLAAAWAGENKKIMKILRQLDPSFKSLSNESSRLKQLEKE